MLLYVGYQRNMQKTRNVVQFLFATSTIVKSTNNGFDAVKILLIMQRSFQQTRTSIISINVLSSLCNDIYLSQMDLARINV